MRLPPQVQTVDDLFQFLMTKLGPEDAYRLQQIIREENSELLRTIRQVSRAEWMINLRRPDPN